MNKITILIPLHKYNEMVKSYLTNALGSIERNSKNTDIVLSPVVVGPEDVCNSVKSDGFNVKTLVNLGDTDFCSQVNFGAKNCETEYFSILEFDDEYTDKWFKMFKEYYHTNEDVSLFLPINVQMDVEDGSYKFENEIIWASAFSNEIGFIDNDCLQHYVAFNITGGVFNTSDFIKIGMLKPSIKVAFSYEFLLRLTNKQLKAYVVPKEGYKHRLKMEDSLLLKNMELSDIEIDKWFRLAKRESIYTEDRKLGIDSVKEEKAAKA